MIEKIEYPIYEFKASVDNLSELEDFINAHINSGILWQLVHNFHRNFKHLNENDDFMKGVYYVLDRLKEELEDYKTE